MPKCRNRKPTISYGRFGRTENLLGVITLGGMLRARVGRTA